MVYKGNPTKMDGLGAHHHMDPYGWNQNDWFRKYQTYYNRYNVIGMMDDIGVTLPKVALLHWVGPQGDDGSPYSALVNYNRL